MRNPKGDFELNKYWHFGWNAIIESDETFRRYYNIDSIYAYERVSTMYLTGMADRNYFNISVSRYGNLTGDYVYNYDTNAYDKQVTSNALPVIDYNYVHNKPVFGGEFSFNVNAVALSIQDPSNQQYSPQLAKRQPRQHRAYRDGYAVAADV